ncbi:hypothetical protein L7F22_069346 [Adiantum nelumboides]|nr:hypothetical protein [Adiantum nelumboides]
MASAAFAFHPRVLLSFMLMLAVASCAGIAQAKEKKLVLYIHITPGVTNSAILNAISGNPRFGPLTAFDLPVTVETSATSTNVGFVRGLGIVFNGTVDSTPVLEHLLSTLFYDDGESTGTLALHGLIDSRFSGLPTELAVVGGTGKFRFANGFVTISFVSAPPVVLNSISLALYTETLNMARTKRTTRKVYFEDSKTQDPKSSSFKEHASKPEEEAHGPDKTSGKTLPKEQPSADTKKSTSQKQKPFEKEKKPIQKEKNPSEKEKKGNVKDH